MEPARFGDVESAHRFLSYVPADVALWPSFSGQECLDLLAGVGPGTDLEYRAELVERFGLDTGNCHVEQARDAATGVTVGCATLDLRGEPAREAVDRIAQL